MSKGYIAIAQNNEEHDYLKLAYAMALSIKATQKENKICICVDEQTKETMQDKYKETARGGLAINGLEMPVSVIEC